MNRIGIALSKIGSISSDHPRDANGAKYRPYDFSIRPVPERDADAELAAIEVRRESEKQWGSLFIQSNRLVIALAIAGFSAFLLYDAYRRRHWWYFALVLGIAIGYFMIMRSAFRGPAFTGHRAKERAMLVAGRCPQCAYDLKRFGAKLGQKVVCPECGAAWIWLADL